MYQFGKVIQRLNVYEMSLCFRSLTVRNPFQQSFSPASTNADTPPPEEPEYGDEFDEESFDFNRLGEERKKTDTHSDQATPRRRSPFGRPAEERESTRNANRRGRSPDISHTPTASELLPITVQPRKHDNERPRYHPSQEPYEGGFVSVDESPYRLREIIQVRELWKESIRHPGRTFDNLMIYMKPLSLWQGLHAYLIGGKALQTIQNHRKQRLRYEQEMRDIRDAVISGEFAWRGKAGIFIQGEMRRGMEPRMYRSDVKEMEEFVKEQREKLKPLEFDRDRKRMLESFFQDRLVTEVLRVVLEPVVEPMFENTSHGFRPGRTQHSALKQVRRDFSDAHWIYRSDLRGVFELLLENRRKFTAQLRRRIEKRVKDETFLELLFSGINTRTVMSDYEINPPEEGYSPLGTKSGIMPLLCNIYFDPLDKWVARKAQEVNRGKWRRVNPERAALILRGADEKVANEILPLDPNDPIFRRLCYCRYADDFLFALSGPREMAMELKEEFWDFASQELLFPLPTCEINHVRFKTRFLGHVLRRRIIMPRKALIAVRRTSRGRIAHETDDIDEIDITSTTYRFPREKPDAEEVALGDSGLTVHRGFDANDSPREILSIDGELDKIVRLLARAGYCQKNGNPQPNFKHLHFAQSETNQVIRRMLLSICDLYRVARNRRRLVHFCSYILRHSAAKLYAAKFKLRSRSKVFKRGGAHLGDRIQHGKGYIGKIDPDTGTSMEEYAELPYARLSEIPKPDLVPTPRNWQPELIHILNEKLLGNIPRF